MTWTYSGNPAHSDKDAVRFEIGDTNKDDQLLSDEEIEFALSAETDTYRAAARCCEFLARKFAREADYRLGPMSVSASQRSEAFRKLSILLRQKAGGGVPYAGGLSKQERITDANSPDLIQGVFKRNLMSNNNE